MDRLKMIFDRQKELMEKYHHIEVKSGLCQTEDNPLDLNCKRSQARIKDFAWRITEELGEAIESLEANGFTDHFQEELVDGLHFLTELTILSGWDYNHLREEGQDHFDGIELLMVESNTIKGYWNPMLVQDFIKELAMMCNTLKNKPWKQTEKPTDLVQYEERLSNAWVTYFSFFKAANMNSDQIVDTYLGKAKINQTRQETQY